MARKDHGLYLFTMTNCGCTPFLKGLFALVVLLLTGFQISCNDKVPNRVSVTIPTAEAESDYIWRTIQDIQFFEEQNYQLSLPSGALIEELKTKAKANSLSDKDYDRLQIFIKDSVYNANDYQEGYKKIEGRLELINKMIDEISQSSFNWNFKEFKTYKINLTLYGPGGSYDPNEGSLLIFTTKTGQFKNYDDPACTIIHEIVHIGMEESLITKYQVPHPLKERIVDGFVFLSFKDVLPEYQIQDMGEKRADTYLREKADLKDLSTTLEIVLGEN